MSLASDLKKAKAARAIASGSTKAEAAREAEVDPAQITRWTKQHEFLEMVRKATEPEDSPQAKATQGLRDLVPQALRVLEDALAGADISPQQQTVALNVIKAAKQLEPVGQAEAGPSTLQAAIEAIERERSSSQA